MARLVLDEPIAENPIKKTSHLVLDEIPTKKPKLVEDIVLSDIKEHPILNLLSPRYGGAGIKTPEEIPDIASKLNPLTLLTKPLEFLPQTEKASTKFSKELLYSFLPTPADALTLGAGKVIPKIKGALNGNKFALVEGKIKPISEIKATSASTKPILSPKSPIIGAKKPSPLLYGSKGEIVSGGTKDFAENINLTKYPKDVRKSISDLIEAKPEIGKTPAISDTELISRARELKDTPTIKLLATLPEGTVETEALKLRQGNTEAVRTALQGELEGLKANLDGIIEQGIGLQRKTASMFGRGLRQQRLPAEIQQGMAFQIDDTIKKVSIDPIFSKDQELLDTLKKLRQIVVEKEFNPTLWNKVYYAWMNSILSNPFTHLVNTASNTLFTASKIPEKFASAVWDLPLALKTGKRTQFFGEIPAMVKGAFSKEKLPAMVDKGSKLEYFSKPIRGKAGKIIGTPSTALQVEDNIFKTLVGKMEMAGQKYAGKTGEELTKVVSAEQLYRTFQNDAGVVADTMMMIRGRIPGLRYVIPFIKTPANLIARGLERTPLGAVKIIKAIANKTYTQETLAKDLGNMTLGTIGAGWVGFQWAKGNITGRIPSDPAERDAFYRQGKKPNSIRIGNKWVPLERIEPLGTSFSVMSNLFEDYKKSDKESIPEKSLDAITKLGSTLINKTYLSGFTQMINALSNPEQYGQNFLRRIATGAEPQILKFFSDLKDPYYREADTILDQLKAKTPFLSETLPPKINVLGEPVKRDFLNIGAAKEDELSKAIVGFPAKTIGKQKLTTKQYSSLVSESGQKAYKVLQWKMNQPDWQTKTQEQKEDFINSVLTKTRGVPREKVAMSILLDGINSAKTEKEKKDFLNKMKESKILTLERWKVLWKNGVIRR